MFVQIRINHMICENPLLQNRGLVIAIVMSSLNLYPLPYTKPQPPPELFRTVETASGCSDTTAFDAGLDERDRDIISGRRICVVCGEYNLALLEHCHIIPKKDKNVVRPMHVQLKSRVGPFKNLLVESAQKVRMGTSGSQKLTHT